MHPWIMADVRYDGYARMWLWSLLAKSRSP
jgi:hypothetical protein